jgi:enoyl-CoA hydratase/carnithine racemase
MNFQYITVEREERLLIVTINRPEVLNALSPEANFEMEKAFDEFENDPELWVAIVTGAGEKAFSVGGDIKSMVAAKETGTTYDVPKSGYGGVTRRDGCHKPIIAAVNGLALGGGFEVALACDLIVAAEHARFGLPEPRIGVVAYEGGMHRLTREIGLKRAMKLLLTAEMIPASEAGAMGLVNEVVPGDQVMATAREIAEKILKCAPLSIQATKQCVMGGLDEPRLVDAILSQDEGRFERIEAMRASKDVIEGITAFTEKRKPVWIGE